MSEVNDVKSTFNDVTWPLQSLFIDLREPTAGIPI